MLNKAQASKTLPKLLSESIRRVIIKNSNKEIMPLI